MKLLVFLIFASMASENIFTSNIAFSGNQNDDIEAKISLTDKLKPVIRILDSHSKPDKKNQFDTITQTTDLEVPGLKYLSTTNEIVFLTANAAKHLCVDSGGQPTGRCEIFIKKNGTGATINLLLKETP